MPTVKILYDVAGWAFYNNAVALRKYAPADFDVSLAAYLHESELDAALGDTPPDILVLCRFQSARKVRDALQRRDWPTKLVSIWINGWPEKVELLAEVLDASDLVVFANGTTWNSAGRPANSVMIPMGVDLDIFKVRVPIEERRPRILWCGSELMRDLKGYDEFAVPLAARFERMGIPCDFRLVDSFSDSNLSPEEMADWYNTGTVFLCTSRTEGTPNVALEAAACGCTLVSTRVGNMPDLIEPGRNGMLVNRAIGPLHVALETAILRHKDLAWSMQTKIASWSWERQSAKFFDSVRSIVATVDGLAPTRIADARPDLSDDVTVFVPTVGSPSFESCLSFLRRQDCRFRIEVIDRVAPMSAAFQTMLDICRTRYFIQCDEDMLLYPHAVRMLHKAITSQLPHVAFFCEYLHDVHLERPLVGIKIFRHDIVRKYPFRDFAGCDVDQNRRLKADGYDFIIAPSPEGRNPFSDCLGLHGVGWTDETIFLRYYTFEARRRREEKFESWQPELLNELCGIFRQDPSRHNFLALTGALIGRMRPNDHGLTEKDFRKYGDTPGLQSLRLLLDDLEARRAQAQSEYDGLEIEALEALEARKRAK